MEAFLIKNYNKFKKCVAKEAFNPTWRGIFLNQFYFSRRALYLYISKFAKKIEAKNILDVGCGSMPYKNLFHAENYTGLEYDTPIARQIYNADVYYDGEKFPFADSCFDCVLSFQVLEHVFHTKDFLKEINRVLEPEGTVLLTAPFIGDEHEQPNDFFRFSSFGIRALFEQAGFEIIEQHKTQNDVTTLIQLINFALNKRFQGPFLLFLTSIFNLLGIVLNAILPKSTDMYSDNVVYAKKRIA